MEKQPINSVYAVQIYSAEGLVNVKKVFSRFEEANKCAEEFNKEHFVWYANVVEYNVQP